MKIMTAPDYQGMCRRAANLISAQIIMKPSCVLGLATGSTPIGIYDQLVEWYQKGDLDFSKVRTVNLDEYVGLGENDSQSYIWFMKEHLFDHVNIKRDSIHIPNGLETDALIECERYNKIIRDFQGIDLQLLGLGHNGHIGFNEPGEAFEKETHMVKLKESTITANARFFKNNEEVPKSAYTMGIKSIMQARRVVVVVSGKEKASIVKEAFMGEVTPKVPASILQLHPDVTVIGDKEAMALLS